MDWSSVDYEPHDFGGATNPLQRISLQIPAGHGLAALPFVIRSEDGALRWRCCGAAGTGPARLARGSSARRVQAGVQAPHGQQV